MTGRKVTREATSYDPYPKNSYKREDDYYGTSEEKAGRAKGEPQRFERRPSDRGQQQRPRSRSNSSSRSRSSLNDANANRYGDLPYMGKKGNKTERSAVAGGGAGYMSGYSEDEGDRRKAPLQRRCGGTAGGERNSDTHQHHGQQWDHRHNRSDNGTSSKKMSVTTERKTYPDDVRSKGYDRYGSKYSGSGGGHREIRNHPRDFDAREAIGCSSEAENLKTASSPGRDIDARVERVPSHHFSARKLKKKDGYVSVEDTDGKTTFYHYTQPNDADSNARDSRAEHHHERYGGRSGSYGSPSDKHRHRSNSYTRQNKRRHASSSGERQQSRQRGRQPGSPDSQARQRSASHERGRTGHHQSQVNFAKTGRTEKKVGRLSVSSERRRARSASSHDRRRQQSVSPGRKPRQSLSPERTKQRSVSPGMPRQVSSSPRRRRQQSASPVRRQDSLNSNSRRVDHRYDRKRRQRSGSCADSADNQARDGFVQHAGAANENKAERDNKKWRRSASGSPQLEPRRLLSDSQGQHDVLAHSGAAAREVLQTRSAAAGRGAKDSDAAGGGARQRQIRVDEGGVAPHEASVDSGSAATDAASKSAIAAQKTTILKEKMMRKKKKAAAEKRKSNILEQVNQILGLKPEDSSAKAAEIPAAVHVKENTNEIQAVKDEPSDGVKKPLKNEAIEDNAIKVEKVIRQDVNRKIEAAGSEEVCSIKVDKSLEDGEISDAYDTVNEIEDSVLDEIIIEDDADVKEKPAKRKVRGL